ncbi:MAG: YjbE family putative metal transport protein [Gammaproteobacteria bacterium]|nr:YjbE family putative metal transport protein [Gammaproteobacteria bacterium]NIR83444.1 YjbE family putative metal transport protein [Gammaproteobacteria bacterium]NIR91366.1 YjbE family putative metal transport protein [Gammaproteobacteria bacterium]NIU04606.1 YjbE family putative metal transport protein [Gammaproteobacteria bacterium]NIV51648.1 YjbE family putative metal transport protein [Gammaproteobacteria bacterium]
MISIGELSALAQVVMVDLVLAGDNAIVVGMVASAVAPEQRARVIMLGIVAATLMRVGFALVTVQLLQILGLTLAGGLLLLWVSWKLWREIEESQRHRGAEATGRGEAARPAPRRPKSIAQAAFQIVLADVSMSLDNVIAVAGIARDHTWVLVIGLALSIAFMAVAATVIARLLQRHHWIAYVGLVIIFYVACSMIWEGTMAVWQAAEAAR